MMMNGKHPVFCRIRGYVLCHFKRLVFASLIAICTVGAMHYFSVNSYLFPHIISFPDLKQVLVPRRDVNATHSCQHILESTLSTEHLQVTHNMSSKDLNWLNSSVALGGVWPPGDCISKYRVNVIVPYRNRELHLWTFTSYLHQFLQRQQIEYRLVVVEQSQGRDFNRGKLFNVGFVEMEKRFPADCYIFHDVDLIPLNLNNIYACSQQPRHMSSAVDVFNFQLPYDKIFGGAVALTRQQFLRVNGYSNSFFGWGGEDDDLYSRVIRAYSIVRFEADIARYAMLSHVKETPNPSRFQTLQKGRYAYATDGLANLNYSLVKLEERQFFTWIFVQF